MSNTFGGSASGRGANTVTPSRRPMPPPPPSGQQQQQPYQPQHRLPHPYANQQQQQSQRSGAYPPMSPHQHVGGGGGGWGSSPPPSAPASPLIGTKSSASFVAHDLYQQQRSSGTNIASSTSAGGYRGSGGGQLAPSQSSSIIGGGAPATTVVEHPPRIIGAFDILKVGGGKRDPRRRRRRGGGHDGSHQTGSGSGDADVETVGEAKARVLLIRTDGLFFLDVEGSAAADGAHPDAIKRHIPIAKLRSVTFFSRVHNVITIGVYGEHDVFFHVLQPTPASVLFGEILSGGAGAWREEALARRLLGHKEARRVQRKHFLDESSKRKSGGAFESSRRFGSAADGSDGDDGDDSDGDADDPPMPTMADLPPAPTAAAPAPIVVTYGGSTTNNSGISQISQQTNNNSSNNNKKIFFMTRTEREDSIDRRFADGSDEGRESYKNRIAAAAQSCYRCLGRAAALVGFQSSFVDLSVDETTDAKAFVSEVRPTLRLFKGAFFDIGGGGGGTGSGSATPPAVGSTGDFEDIDDDDDDSDEGNANDYGVESEEAAERRRAMKHPSSAIMRRKALLRRDAYVGCLRAAAAATGSAFAVQSLLRAAAAASAPPNSRRARYAAAAFTAGSAEGLWELREEQQREFEAEEQPLQQQQQRNTPIGGVGAQPQHLPQTRAAKPPSSSSSSTSSQPMLVPPPVTEQTRVTLRYWDAIAPQLSSPLSLEKLLRSAAADAPYPQPSQAAVAELARNLGHEYVVMMGAVAARFHPPPPYFTASETKRRRRKKSGYNDHSNDEAEYEEEEKERQRQYNASIAALPFRNFSVLFTPTKMYLLNLLSGRAERQYPLSAMSRLDLLTTAEGGAATPTSSPKKASAAANSARQFTLHFLEGVTSSITFALPQEAAEEANSRSSRNPGPSSPTRTIIERSSSPNRQQQSAASATITAQSSTNDVNAIGNVIRFLLKREGADLPREHFVDGARVRRDAFVKTTGGSVVLSVAEEGGGAGDGDDWEDLGGAAAAAAANGGGSSPPQLAADGSLLISAPSYASRSVGADSPPRRSVSVIGHTALQRGSSEADLKALVSQDPHHRGLLSGGNMMGAANNSNNVYSNSNNWENGASSGAASRPPTSPYRGASASASGFAGANANAPTDASFVSSNSTSAYGTNASFHRNSAGAGGQRGGGVNQQQQRLQSPTLSRAEFDALPNLQKKQSLAEAKAMEEAVRRAVPDFREPIDPKSRLFHGPNTALARQILRLTSKGVWEPRTLVLHTAGTLIIADNSSNRGVRRTVPLAQISEITPIEHHEGPALAIGVSQEHDLVFKLAPNAAIGAALTLPQVVTVMQFLQEGLVVLPTERYRSKESLRGVLRGRNFTKPKDYLSVADEVKLARKQQSQNHSVDGDGGGNLSPRSLKRLAEPSRVYDSAGRLTPRRIREEPSAAPPAAVPVAAAAVAATAAVAAAGVGAYAYTNRGLPTTERDDASRASVAAAEERNPFSTGAGSSFGRRPASSTLTPSDSRRMPSSSANPSTQHHDPSSATPSSTSSAIQHTRGGGAVNTAAAAAAPPIVVAAVPMPPMENPSVDDDDEDHYDRFVEPSAIIGSPPNTIRRTNTNTITNNSNTYAPRDGAIGGESYLSASPLDTIVSGAVNNNNNNPNANAAPNSVEMRSRGGSGVVNESTTNSSLRPRAATVASDDGTVILHTNNTSLLGGGGGGVEGPTAAETPRTDAEASDYEGGFSRQALPLTPPLLPAGAASLRASSPMRGPYSHQQNNNGNAAQGGNPLTMMPVEGSSASSSVAASSLPPSTSSQRPPLYTHTASQQQQHPTRQRGSVSSNDAAPLEAEPTLFAPEALAAMARSSATAEREGATAIAAVAAYKSDGDGDSTASRRYDNPFTTPSSKASAVGVPVGSMNVAPSPSTPLAAATSAASPEVARLEGQLSALQGQVAALLALQQQQMQNQSQNNNNCSAAFYANNASSDFAASLYATSTSGGQKRDTRPLSVQRRERLGREREATEDMRRGRGRSRAGAVWESEGDEADGDGDGEYSSEYSRIARAKKKSDEATGAAAALSAVYSAADYNSTLSPSRRRQQSTSPRRGAGGGNPHGLSQGLQQRFSSRVRERAAAAADRYGGGDNQSFNNVSSAAANNNNASASLSYSAIGPSSAASAPLLDRRQLEREAVAMGVATFRVKIGASDVFIAHWRGAFVGRLMAAAEEDAQSLFPPPPSAPAAGAGAKRASSPSYASSSFHSQRPGSRFSSAARLRRATSPQNQQSNSNNNNSYAVTPDSRKQTEAAASPPPPRWDTLAPSDRCVLVCSELPLVLCLTRAALLAALSASYKEALLVEPAEEEEVMVAAGVVGMGAFATAGVLPENSSSRGGSEKQTPPPPPDARRGSSFGSTHSGSPSPQPYPNSSNANASQQFADSPLGKASAAAAAAAVPQHMLTATGAHAHAYANSSAAAGAAFTSSAHSFSAASLNNPLPLSPSAAFASASLLRPAAHRCRTAERLACRSGNTFRWAPLSVVRVLEAVGAGVALTRLVDQYEAAAAAVAR